MQKPMQRHINVGSGECIQIMDLAERMRMALVFKGILLFDLQMPDGSLQKLMNSARINILDWKASARIECGLLFAYQTSLKLMVELHRPKLLSYSI